MSRQRVILIVIKREGEIGEAEQKVIQLWPFFLVSFIAKIAINDFLFHSSTIRAFSATVIVQFI